MTRTRGRKPDDLLSAGRQFSTLREASFNPMGNFVFLALLLNLFVLSLCCPARGLTPDGNRMVDELRKKIAKPLPLAEQGQTFKWTYPTSINPSRREGKLLSAPKQVDKDPPTRKVQAEAWPSSPPIQKPPNSESKEASTSRGYGQLCLFLFLTILCPKGMESCLNGLVSICFFLVTMYFFVCYLVPLGFAGWILAALPVTVMKRRG